MRKKLFATLLAFALIASPTTIFAENVSATDTETVTEENTESIVPEENEAETTESAGRTVPHYTLSNDGDQWTGTYYYLPDGTMATDAFFCDGTYTYYLQKDGTPMKDRLTYHPNGQNIIYLDNNGHEVFDNFVNVKRSITGEEINDICYFDTFGYMYVDKLTYDRSGTKLYYLNPYGVLQKGWFQFSDGNYGATYDDGSLVKDQFYIDLFGRTVYCKGDGKFARETITDGIWYYEMDPTDGHLIRQYKKAFNYFAIGNSLTTHPVIDGIWWGNWGMAASTRENDFVHKVCSSLEQNYEVHSNAIYYTSWETAADRNSQLSILDPYLTADLDLVTIQLGDNITGNFGTLTSDYQNLIGYVRSKAPNAQIMVIDEFCWPNGTIQQAQQTASSAYGADYISLAAIQNINYKVGAATVAGDDGQMHTIYNGAVGCHPNDAGMQYIADQILQRITVKK
ncbi:MAG: SGNH/GDSL hydrolase family protein [Lachnospiraceae bacterium]|uniref:SGNH/GDSL hydrolase family protein n=1 Tax=Roseburia hominis TaxID=301301 RepID=UPI001F241D15|nr:SGNH/GDSL hydrolase family protein [Roseburia hominis]MCI5711925.1 SGNH/GDSL hydrolase family protein [Lachnospiraceae bacterium]MDD6168991.1 SGNH/GDSL hydrolase family protein [Lachnospiraceae bacterium]MDY4837966.1 SGNH/GDSL hydrolase family protein [Lachnospiraceae bacterium]